MLLALLLFQTSWFKNYATDLFTEHLSEELNTEVSIDNISIDYFDQISATQVFLADQSGDTMIYIQELSLNYEVTNFSSKLLKLDKIRVKNGNVQIGTSLDSSRLNIQHLIKYFSPPKKNNTKESSVIVFDKIELINTSFRYFNENLPKPTSHLFNENDFTFDQISGHLHDFQIHGDSLDFKIDDLSGIEKSGFPIKNLSTGAILSPQKMQFSDLELITNKSKIEDFLEFSYDSYVDFSSFVDRVTVRANFNNCVIHTDDLAYFSIPLRDMKEKIYANGEVKGTINDLSSKDIGISLGEHTKFQGSVNVQRITNLGEAYFTINSNELRSNAKDLSRLIGLSSPPEEFLKLGTLSYLGTFQGSINKFKANAKISTDIGKINTSIDYFKPSQSAVTYTGNIASSDFNLKELTGSESLGIVHFNLDIDGKGLTLEELKSSVSGEIKEFTFDKYTYKNMVIDGNISDNLFVGDFQIADPNFNLSFNGKMDLSKSIPEISARTNVRSINLKQLGLDSLNTILTFNGDISLQGENIDNLTGHIELESITLNREERIYRLRDVTVSALTEKDQRLYTLSSDIGNVEARGIFEPSEIGKLLDHVKNSIYPSQYDKPVEELISEYIQVTLSIPEYNSVFGEFLGSIRFDSVSSELSYNHFLGKIDGKTTIDNFSYDVISTPSLALSFKNGGNLTPINFGLNSEGLYQNDSVLFDILNLNGFIKDGLVNFETTSKKDSLLDIIISGHLKYQNDTANLYLDNTKVNIYEKPWTLRKTNFPNIIITNGIVEFRYFYFQHEDEILFIDASIGENSNKVNANLLDFKLENLTPFLAGYNLNVSGITNGYIDISNREGFPIIEADLGIADLMLDEDTLGTVELVSTYKDGLLAEAIDGKVTGGLLNEMKILGDIDFRNKTSPLNLTLTSERSNIRPFERYLKGLASNISGFSTSNVKITGPLSSPQLKGIMQLDSLDFIVDYLQTNYEGKANIALDYTSFKVTEASIFDQFGQEGKISGGINHSNFQDFQFDLIISDLKNFEIMNTSREDNELFYGTAFVDGRMNITGPLDDILLQIYAKSRKGTDIAIPLDYAETSGKLSYVEFVNFKKDTAAGPEPQQKISGVKMDFNFELTNDANISLIFDELLGDKIEAAGHGNLRMDINTFGDFSIYGGITVDRGSYLFTALNLISKPFTLEPGGTLFWDGNPYNAKINLDAIKREYAAPLKLVSNVTDAEREQYSKTLPVDCYLNLKGLLFDPEVSFDLQFPTQTGLSGSASSNLNTAIERIKLDQEELNRQVFALLVLGSFVPPSFATAEGSGIGEGVTASAGINSLSDFASSQLNNWLGQLDTRWQVGIDYQQSLSENGDNTELILSLKRKWLNDRLEFSYSIDAADQRGSRPYDISINYDINAEGNLKVRGFQKLATDPTLGNLTNVNTTGVGLYYRYQFDKFRLQKKKLKTEKSSK